jgi:predicted alpha-1,2-mannosidase
MNLKIVYMKQTIIFLVSICMSLPICKAKDPVSFVNVFVGTGGHGHTFPGATLPYGMVQLSPDTRTAGWDACAGYHYLDSTILGFSHTHLSGTGIGDYGDVLFMPFSGEAKIMPGTPQYPDSGYRSRFSHKEEQASPGYYSVRLATYDIFAELTTSARAGFHRYTYKKGGKSGVIIDLSHTIHNGQNSVNEIHIISDTEIEGLKLSRGWASKQYIYFYAKFSKPFSYKLFTRNKEVLGMKEVNSVNSKVVLSFDTKPNEKVLVKVGISPVDYAGAKNNLVSEIKDWDFDHVVSLARQVWNTQLDKIKLDGGTENEKVIFYSALYHTSISPNIFSDADGRYRGMDQKIHIEKGFTNYTVFSLWDTFRAFHPLMTITEPERDCDFIKALLSKYDEGGILPKWELAANYTGTMTGYNAIPVIVDAYMKDIRGFDVNKALTAMIRSSLYDTTGILFPSNEIKNKLMPKGKYYNQTLGYLPADVPGVSRPVAEGLEFAYDDWCIAQMAKGLNNDSIYRKYMDRSMHYKKYYDPSVGFMRGKNLDGTWKTPFDPKSTSTGLYAEGNAWQWSWFVPQDVKGFVELSGGRQKFILKLDSLFTIDSGITGGEHLADVTGLIGQYAHGNEPSHHIAYFYNYVGQPWKTQRLVDTILNTFYFNDPDGLSGNEDCGQMSAWYILSAMGIYSFCPGDPNYTIGRPLFDKVTISLPGKKQFVITAKGNSKRNKYIQSASLNGKIVTSPFISHKDIVNGGELIVQMGPSPNDQWGRID